MITSHQLAKSLLDGPDLPVELAVIDAKDGYIGDIGDCTTKIMEIDIEGAKERGFDDIQPGNCVRLKAWQSGPTQEEDY